MFEGFVHASGGRLVDGLGQPLILRGVGLGNWLLPEGYMWKFEHPMTQSPREIEALIVDLVGLDLAADFWQRFRTTFITEDDIARIRAEGMNHVRLPINSRVVMDDAGELIESGLQLIDRTVDWCRKHQLWVVLDLHGAPGGQTGTNIDDSPRHAPELFTDERYRTLTVKLWQAMARRYRDDTAVAAYDLLNEPLPNAYQHLYAGQLRDLYRDLTAVIRAVDPNHMISYEGTHWATNWDLFTEVWDSNSILQFHKYWSAPDRPSIQRYIDVGRELGLPIYMGEGGENNLDWTQTAFQLFDDSAISWNFWTWKKVETLTSPYSVNAPPGWTEITDYAAGKGAKPDSTRAHQTLNALLDAMVLTRCTYRPEVMSSVLRRPPLRIPAFGFGFRGAGESYETSAAVPVPGFRTDDLVTIRRANGIEDGELDWNRTDGVARAPADELLVSLRAGDWVAYEIAVPSPSRLQIAVALKSSEAASGNGLVVDISIDGTRVLVEDHTDAMVNGSTDQLSAGRHIVRLTGLLGDALVRWIEVIPASGG
ncbi:MAG TPA: cellulase family glycosylhydrolase [Candidatus Dormibacteraeota bacterium]|nr:cellulase family glycosylhydrolase [Candidatus Dormibacteraeota bacterium]